MQREVLTIKSDTHGNKMRKRSAPWRTHAAARTGGYCEYRNGHGYCCTSHAGDNIMYCQDHSVVSAQEQSLATASLAQMSMLGAAMYPSNPEMAQRMATELRSAPASLSITPTLQVLTTPPACKKCPPSDDALAKANAELLKENEGLKRDIEQLAHTVESQKEELVKEMDFVQRTSEFRESASKELAEKEQEIEALKASIEGKGQTAKELAALRAGCDACLEQMVELERRNRACDIASGEIRKQLRTAMDESVAKVHKLEVNLGACNDAIGKFKEALKTEKAGNAKLQAEQTALREQLEESKKLVEQLGKQGGKPTEEMAKKCQQSSEDLAMANARVIGLEQRATELAETIKKLEDELQTSRAAVAQSEATYADQIRRNTELDTYYKSTLQSTHEELNKATSELKSVAAEFETNKAAMQQLEAKYGELKGVFESNAEEKAKLEKQLEDQTAEVARLTDALETQTKLGEDVKARDEYISKLKAEMQNLSEINAGFSSKLLSLQQEHEQSLQANTQSEKRCEEIAQASEQLKGENTALRTSLSEVVAKIKELESTAEQFTRVQAENAALIKAVETAKAELQTMEETNKTLLSKSGNEIQDLAEAKQKADSELAAIRAELQDTVEKLASADARMLELEAELQKANTVSDQKLKALEDKLKVEASESVKAAESDKQALERRLQELTAELEQMKTRSAASIAELQGVNARYSELETRLKESGDQLTAYDKELMALRSDKQGFDQKLAEADIELQRARVDAQEEQMRLTEAMADVKRQLERTEAGSKQLETDNQSLRLQLQGLEQTNVQLSAESGSKVQQALLEAKTQSDIFSADLQAKLSTTESKLSYANGKNKELETKLAKKGVDLHDCADKLEATTAKLGKLKADSDETFKSQKALIDGLYDENVRLKQQYADAVEKLTKSARDTGDIASAIASVATRITQQHTLKSSLEVTLTTINSKILKLTEAASTDKSLEASLQDLKRQRDGTKEQISKIDKLIAATNKERDQLNTLSKSCLSQVADLQLLLQRKMEEIAELHENVEAQIASQEAVVKYRACDAERAAEYEKNKRLQVDLNDVAYRLKLANEQLKPFLEETARIAREKELSEHRCDAVVQRVNTMIDQVVALQRYTDEIHKGISRIEDEKAKFTAIESLKPIGTEVDILITKWIDPIKSLFPLDSANTQTCIALDRLLKTKSDEYERDMLIIPPLRMRAVNIFEDNIGAVRVYVRIRRWVLDPRSPLYSPIHVIPNPKDPDHSTLVTTSATRFMPDPSNPKVKMLDISTAHGPFFSSYPEDWSNESIYTGIRQDPTSRTVGDTIAPATAPTQGLANVFGQLESGYTVILFGYGLSGSGKTYTLFGDSKTKTPGIVQIGLSKLKDNAKSTRLEMVFELYCSTDLTPAHIHSKLHLLYIHEDMNGKYQHMVDNYLSMLPDKTVENNIVKKELDEYKGVSDKYANRDINSDNVYTLTDETEKYRWDRGRVKQTPLNPKSSRSHLVFIFKITFKDGVVGHLVVMDMAGKENPSDFTEMFLGRRGAIDLTTMLMPRTKLEESMRNLWIPYQYIRGEPAVSPAKEVTSPSVGLLNGKQRYGNLYFEGEQAKSAAEKVGGVYLRSDNRLVFRGLEGGPKWVQFVPTAVTEMIREGLYVNETIHHLSCFLERKRRDTCKAVTLQQFDKTALPNYDPQSVFHDPQLELDNLENLDSGKGIKGRLNYVLWISQVLKFFDKLSDDRTKVTKFVMICNVRQDKSMEEQTESTLAFADSVASTVVKPE
jgi:chromosome segregation ATPase